MGSLGWDRERVLCMDGMLLWKKRGDQLNMVELENGCTLLESDSPPQVLNSPDIPGILERETQKHLPEGYQVQAGREENKHAYHVKDWRIAEWRGARGIEDHVIRILIDLDALKNCFRNSKDWRIDLIYWLQEDFNARNLSV